MKGLQRMGGVAALIEALTYIIGFVVFFTLLAPTENFNSTQYVTFLVENHTIMSIWNLIIYVVFGIFLVVLTLALHARLKDTSPAIAQIATAFGLIWAGLVIASGMVTNIGLSTIANLYEQDPTQATLVWLALSPVQDGLGGGNEIVGGLWVLLISWAALRTSGIPKTLNYLGIVIGMAGILSTIPAFSELGGIIFGLGQIVWFVWLGFVLLLDKTGVVAKNPDVFAPHHSPSN